MTRYTYKPFPYRKAPELSGEATETYPVAIIGAGPIGLAAAIDLALHGIKVVVLDDNDVVSIGSRAICWAKRSLEVFDRLGVGNRMLEKGVTWRVGRLFRGDHEIYSFDLLPEEGHKMPAFINLQQYYVEEYLVDRCGDFEDLIDLRWKSRVTDHVPKGDGVVLEVDTPDGPYSLKAGYVLACDGAGSPTRERMGLRFEGQEFDEQFLIADVEMAAEFPSERWFWFEPPFHQGQSALLHKQPDNIYRIDLQLGPDADPEHEKKLDVVEPRIRQVLGGRPFEIDWVSVYSFRCARLQRFVHDRVIFVGDSAHIVSPFGARGGNGGIQDVDNLIWKLAAVIKGDAPDRLLGTYDEERVHGADENILHSSRATNFMTPKSDMEAVFRTATLDLAEAMPFARRLVNSGRLSSPCSLEGLSLQTPSANADGLAPGSPCPDAPLSDGNPVWLLSRLGGGFSVLTTGGLKSGFATNGLPHLHIAHDPDDAPAGAETLIDKTGAATERYGTGAAYLIRPDQHIAARLDPRRPASLHAALDRATGKAA